MVEINFSSHAQGAKKIKMYNFFTSQGFWNKSYENFFFIFLSRSGPFHFEGLSMKTCFSFPLWATRLWWAGWILLTASGTVLILVIIKIQMIINHQSNIKYPIFTKRAQSGRVLFFRILFRHCWRAQLSSWRGWFRSGGHQSLARTKKCQELLLHKNIFENHLCYIFAFCKFRSPGFVRRHISHWQDHLKTYIRYHDGDNDDSHLVSLMICVPHGSSPMYC